MRVVVSVASSALSPAGRPTDLPAERRQIRESAAALADMIGHHQTVVTYGTAPQVDLLAEHGIEAWPDAELDEVEAESDAVVGYPLVQELRNQLGEAAQVALLLTQVVVNPNDPEFRSPSVPVGPVFDRDYAGRMAAYRHWLVVPAGAGWQRAVPAPEPLRIVEVDTIRLLLEGGVTVVCGGGGGVPVAYDYRGDLRGLSAVVDQDLAAGVLATQLVADRLVILDDSRKLDQAVTAVSDVRGAYGAADPIPRSVEAACRFVERTGRSAALGPISDARAVLDGNAGLTVVGGR